MDNITYRIYLEPEGKIVNGEDIEEYEYYNRKNQTLQNCCSLIDQYIETYSFFKAIIIKQIGDFEHRTDDLEFIAYARDKEKYYDWRDNLKAKKLKKEINYENL